MDTRKISGLSHTIDTSYVICSWIYQDLVYDLRATLYHQVLRYINVYLKIHKKDFSPPLRLSMCSVCNYWKVIHIFEFYIWRIAILFFFFCFCSMFVLIYHKYLLIYIYIYWFVLLKKKNLDDRRELLMITILN